MKFASSLTPAELSVLGDKLRKAPAIEYDLLSNTRPLSRLEAVALLKDDITAMRDKGYRVVEIAEFLSNNGLKISDAALYSSMCKLGCSLTRPRVSVAQMIAHLQAKDTADGEGPPLESVLPRAARKIDRPAKNVGRQGYVGPAMVKIQSKAQPLMKKLKPGDVAVFNELLTQLACGNQRIQLDAELADSGARLIALGLLRKVEGQVDRHYEVPFEVAHVSRTARRDTSYRGE